MHILNFNFLTLFGGELCDEQTQKMRKMRKLVRGETGLKSRDPQKPHLGPLLNVHTKFQLLSSILKGDSGTL